MATKYSDIIRLEDFLPVYDILDDNPKAWKSFIPTMQFCDLLRQSLSAITSKEVSKRKSVWVRGTFGTGKSHASAVVKHLLCDDYADIKDYLNNIPDVELRAQISNLRQGGKKYFAVTLKGVEKAYDIPRFILSLQRETEKAIKSVYPEFMVKSDFHTAIEWIEKHRDIFETNILENDDELYSTVIDTQDVINRLKAFDTSIYIMVERAVKENIGSVFEHQSISEWLVEVSKEIQDRGIADGLIIFWDEFTSVMDTLKSDRINLLQNIAEKSQKNNVFLYLISHRIETQGSDTKGEDISKMSDRYVHIAYRMDQLSTYLIMRHSFTLPLGEKIYENIFKPILPRLQETLNFISDNSPEQRSKIKSLLPLHPYTAFLGSTISNFVGSSNRSVVRFMHDKKDGFEGFLNKEENFGTGMLLTADALWDFFYNDFEEDMSTSSFTSTFVSFHDNVLAQGEDYLRVFKAILLLNALSPKFKTDQLQLSPEDKVLQLMFAGDRMEHRVPEILDWLNDNQVVPRNVFGVFKITGSAYNPTEMNAKRQKVRANYKTSYDVLEYDVPSKDRMLDLFKVGETVRRETLVQFFSCEENESLLRSRLNKFTQVKDNYLHVAIFLSIEDTERDKMNTILKGFSSEFENLVFVLPDETFSKKGYDKFVDCIAMSLVAESHFNTNEAKDSEKQAHVLVKKWVEALVNNTYIVYFNGGMYVEGTVAQLPDLFNYKLAVKAYPHGFESVKEFGKKGVKDNFFVDKNCPAIVKTILEASTSSQIMNHSGNPEPIRYIFEDSGKTLLTPKGELSEHAKNSNVWITNVCCLMDECMEEAHKKYADRFSLGEVLAPFLKPPFGFFTSFANCSALAFAIRKHKKDLFTPGISQPISDDKLCDMLVEIFKAWTKEGKAESQTKFQLRFGSPEETELKSLIIELFDLKKVPGLNIKEIQSLENAKWGVMEFCKKVSRQPLWTLLYNSSVTKDQKDAIRDLIYIFEQENPSVDKIKKTFNSLKNDNVSLNILLTDPIKYKVGFKTFVAGIEEAPIPSEWWDEMLEAIETLQSEVAFRKEADVRQKIVAFYIQKTKSKEDEKKGGYGNSGNTISGTSNEPPAPKPSPNLIKEAKTKIKSLNMPNMYWQRLALDLLEDHPELANFFAEFSL